MKLHIGCGNKYLPGWKHLDIVENSSIIDYVTNAQDLSMIKTATVSEIYACHILEHFGRHEVENVLKEWNRVLVVGGILRIAVPDFNRIMEIYNKNRNLEQVMGLLYGGQDNEYNFHYQAFDFSRTKGLLESCNFQNITRYDWKDFLPVGFDDYSRAYIPHMDFENGTLMSLNMMAEKCCKSNDCIK